MNKLKKIIFNLTDYWIYKKKYLPVGTDLFVDFNCKLLFNNMHVIFDVGANTGQTLKWFRSNWPNTKIYSFEPVKSTFDQLVNNAAKDPFSIQINEALGATTGSKSIRLFDQEMAVLNSLHDNVMNNSSGAIEEIIIINTIDDFCNFHKIENIDLLKIDTEGYEINVLMGAERMLDKGNISFVYSEIGFHENNNRNTYLAKLTEFLEPFDFYFFGLYHVDNHDWMRGNGLGNALFVHKSVYPNIKTSRV
jgi:FkbM family methyltransferase